MDSEFSDQTGQTVWADPENRRGGGGGAAPDNFFSHQRISQRAVRTSLEKQMRPRGPN